MPLKTFSERAIQAIAENKIKAAMDQGEFENLPGFGKPFEFDDSQYDPHWWIRRKVEWERMKNLFQNSPRLGNDNSISPAATGRQSQ
jgi:hypothetical protein